LFFLTNKIIGWFFTIVNQ